MYIYIYIYIYKAIVLQICSTGCLSHGHGYECHITSSVKSSRCIKNKKSVLGGGARSEDF